MVLGRLLAFLACMLLLAACSGPQLPFAKEEPAKGAAENMVRPPWEAYVQAGPGADNDIDLETLNGPLMPQPPMAQADVPPPAKDTVAAPAPQPEEPPPPAKDDGAIRFAAVPVVTGAGSSGNGELTDAMRQVLKDAGWPVLTAKRKDALTIQGTVTLDKPTGETQVVRIVWQVAAPDGRKLGDIKQENSVPAGALKGSWGDNAQFAAEAAAEGIFKLIQGLR